MSEEEERIVANSFRARPKRVGWLVLDLRRDFVETHTLVNEGAFDKYCFPWTPAKLGRRSAILHHLSLFPPSLPEFDLTGIA